MALANVSNNTVYAQVSCGKFIVKSGGSQKEYNSIDGTLESISCYWDKGSAEHHVSPHDAVQIVLLDGDQRFVAKATLGNNGEATTFGWMVASYIGAVAKGERIRIDVWPGTDNNKVSCCKVYAWDGGQYRPVERREFPTDRAERLIEAKAVIKDHDAYVRAEKDNEAEPTAETVLKGNARILCDAEIKFWQTVYSWHMVGYLNAQDFWNEFLGKLLKREVRDLADVSIQEWAVLNEFVSAKKLAGKIPNSIQQYLDLHGEYDPFANE